MSIAEHMLPEFDHEMASTRALLERVPETQPAWKPHAKSMSLGDLAVHVASIPAYCTFTVRETELDLNPPDGTPLPKPGFGGAQALLNLFDDNVRDARAALSAASDGDLMELWTLKNAGQVIFCMPRVAVYRTMVMNHLIHHRGQLTVYLRLLDVPLPSTYGPSADTQA